MRVVTRSGILLLLLSVSSLSAQQAPRFGETLDVTIVEIDAVVTDRDGNPVHGLTADDFEVLEERRRQTITNFSEFRGASAVGTTGRAERPEPRTIVLLLDTLPIHGPHRDRVFEGLAEMVRSIMRPEDRIGIVQWDVTMNKGRTLLEPTGDRRLVAVALEWIGGPRHALADLDALTDRQAEMVEKLAEAPAPRRAALNERARLTMIGRFHTEETIIRLRRKTAVMERLAGSIGARDGKKIILYVAHDLPMPTRADALTTTARLLDSVVETANAYGVSFYGVQPEWFDPGLLATAERSTPRRLLRFRPSRDPAEALLLLAQATGGTVERGAAAMANLAAGLERDLGSYYSLGYRARSDGSDRTRNVTVRAKNPEYRVRARRSYVEKSDETFAREQLVARLFAEKGAGELTFSIETGEPRPARRNRSLVPVAMHIPLGQLRFEKESDGRIVAQVKVFVVAGNGITEVNDVTETAFAIIATPDTDETSATYTHEFQLLADERGSIVSIGLFDERTGLAGYRTLDFRETSEVSSLDRSYP